MTAPPGNSTGPGSNRLTSIQHYRAARIITEASAPAVLVSLVLLIVGWHATPRSATGIWSGLAASMFAVIIPFAFIVNGVRRGRLTDHHVGRREQRRKPLLVALASTIVGWGVLVASGAPRDVMALLGAGTVALIVTLTVSHWWKMSVHAGVACGSIVVLVIVFGPPLLAVAPLLVLIGWSRVQLGDHTVAQVLCGNFVGGAIAAVVFCLLR